MPKTTEKKTTIGIRPLMGYVLVDPAEAETQTRSGIYLSESSQEKPAQGVIVAIGEDIVLPNGAALISPVKLGDKVVYKKWGGDELKVSGKEYKIVKFEDLMAIID